MKNKGMKMLSCLLAVVISFSFVLAGCNNNDSEDNDSIIEADKHNQTGISVDGINISWANMKVDNSKLKLTEDQKAILQYFDNDYLYVSDYDSLQRYPKIFRHAQVEFHAEVVKILEADDSTYTCLAKLHGNNDYEPDSDYINENYIVISGNQPEEGRIIEGDSCSFFGRYMDVTEYEIDGKTNYYPSFNVFYSLSEVKFDASYIKKVAKIIFGQDIKLEDPMSNSDYMLDENHPNGYVYYLVTLDNQSNANFSSFEFNAMNGFIRDANLKENIERQFFVSADFQHYIITVFDRNLNTAYLEYYDRDLKKIWSKEFEDTESMVMDYTAESIYITTNNDLYGIDISNGKDLFDPVYVGEKIDINLLEDGIILIGTGNKDNVMKLDLKGKMIWKTSIDMEIVSCSSLQIIDQNIVGYYYDDNYAQKMVSVDKDGTVISEFECAMAEVY